MKDESTKQPASQAEPLWADGLKRIYSSVLDEPLPDVFEQLLDKLDKADRDDRTK